MLYETSEFDLWEPDPQPWRRSYGPFRNNKIVDLGIFIGSVLFLLLLVVPATSRTAFYSLTGLDLSFIIGFIIAFAGIAIYFGVGERYRKQSTKQPTPTNWTADVLLLLAGVLFVVGGIVAGIFSLHLPSTLAEVVLGAAVGSVVVGLLISYGYKKLKKSEDLSL